MSQIKIEDAEHVTFHFEERFPGVCIVGYVAEFFYLRGIDFFEFRCDEHGCDAYELQSISANVAEGQVAVYVGHGEEECVGRESIFKADFHEPIHENGSHGWIDICLYGLHIGGGRST